MTIRFQCGDCQTRIKVPDDCSGRKVKCPKCDATQVAPNESIRATAEVPVMAGAAANDMTGVFVYDPEQAALQASADLEALALASQRGDELLVGEVPDLDENASQEVDAVSAGDSGVSSPRISPARPQPKVIHTKDRMSGGRSMPSPKPVADDRRRRRSSRPDQTTSSILSATWPTAQRPAVPSEVVPTTRRRVEPAPAFTSLNIATWLLRLMAVVAAVATGVQISRLNAIEATSEELFIWGARGAVAVVAIWAFAEVCGAVRNMARNSYH